jgi:ParB family chromosome partitioning protein
VQLKLSQIVADSTNNARTNLTGIEELAASIKENGLLQPVVVESILNKKGEPTDRYTLRAGFRRFFAVQSLGLDTVEAVVAEGDGDVLNLVENLQRVDISSYDYAVALHKLKAGKGLSANKLAKLLVSSREGGLGTSVSSINNLVRLVSKLDPNILECWANNHPAATVPNLLTVVGKVDQIKAWNILIGAEQDDGGEEDSDVDPSEEEREEAPKKRSAGQILKMVELLKASDSVDKEALKNTLSAFKWVLGGQKTVLGYSLD